MLNAPKRTEFHADLHDERRVGVSVRASEDGPALGSGSGSGDQ